MHSYKAGLPIWCLILFVHLYVQIVVDANIMCKTQESVAVLHRN